MLSFPGHGASNWMRQARRGVWVWKKGHNHNFLNTHEFLMGRKNLIQVGRVPGS